MAFVVEDRIDKTVAKTVIAFDAKAEDAVLVAAAKNHEMRAFEILVVRYRERTLRTVQRFSLRQEDAEDAVQQAFQKAFLHLRGFEGKSSFSTWMTRIATNEALMLLRRYRACREVALEDKERNEEDALEIPDSRLGPEASYSQREQKTILSAAIKELTPGMRAAVELRQLKELSARETAEIMGLSVEAVKGRLFHARRKLRKRLKSYSWSDWASA
jgi:RNA polymerase sigma factor (sigma-70 family)